MGNKKTRGAGATLWLIGLAVIILSILSTSFSCSHVTAAGKPAEVERVIDAINNELGSQLKLDLLKSGEITAFPPVKSFEYFGDKYAFKSSHEANVERVSPAGGLTWENGNSTFFLSYVTPPGNDKNRKTVVLNFKFSPPKADINPLVSKDIVHVLDGELVINKTTKSYVDKAFGKPGRLTHGEPTGPWNITDSCTYYDPRDNLRWLYLSFNDEGILVGASFVYDFR